MFASLHGSGNLAALAFEFSPVVERTASDTVMLDVSGLDRLFGCPQDVAAAIARRAAETGVRANLALASNPDAALCAARGFPGVSILPYGDEAKFLGPLPLAALGPSSELLETLERWGIRRFRDLAAHPPPAPVIQVWMGMNPVKPRAAQGGLFIPMTPEPVKLEITLARIKAVVGEDRAGSPELLDTHRPGAFHMTSFGRAAPAAAMPARAGAALRIYRPPRPARVILADTQPGFVAADGIRGKVLEAAGPWRTSGDWWTADPWRRDEWDIALTDGVLYRLYCDPRGWFVEGSYD